MLRRFGALARERAEALAVLIAREVGKALWDARAEAQLLAAKVDVTLADGMRFVADFDAGPGARATFHPRGVLAVLGPFNFPAHLPNGHIVPALATGNAVVLKPSELAPAVGAWMADLWREAGLPAGVLEVVQGDADVGRALALHPDVDGVLFTGSWAAGRALAEATLDQPGKLLALEMGGKNAMIVCADADLALAVSEAALSICSTTGQRCSSLSRIFVAESLCDAFGERLARVLAGVRSGAPLDEGVFMGPLVSEAAHARLVRYRALATEAGGERVPIASTERAAALRGARPRPLPRRAPAAPLPPRRDLRARSRSLPGRRPRLRDRRRERLRLRPRRVRHDAARAHYEHAIGRIRTGVLNWNRGTIGASGRLPFGGGRRSGNDRPAGIFATLYCTAPQAHLESEAASIRSRCRRIQT